MMRRAWETFLDCVALTLLFGFVYSFVWMVDRVLL